MDLEAPIKAIAAVGSGILTVAIIAVIVGRNSQTANVITTGGNVFTNIVKAAVAPALGGSSIPSLPTSPLSTTPLGSLNTSGLGGFSNLATAIGNPATGVNTLTSSLDQGISGNQDFFGSSLDQGIGGNQDFFGSAPSSSGSDPNFGYSILN